MTLTSRSVGFLMVMLCPAIKPEINDLDEILPMIHDLTNISTSESINEYDLKLRAPIVYTVEDLKMSLSLLLIVLIMIFVWYGLARCIIYLAYHTTERKLEDLDDIEDDLTSV